MTSCGTGQLNIFIRTVTLAFRLARVCHEQTKYITAFDLTRDVASIPARPAAIEEAAITFPSLIQVNRVAHLGVRSTLDTVEYSCSENTYPYRS